MKYLALGNFSEWKLHRMKLYPFLSEKYKHLISVDTWVPDCTFNFCDIFYIGVIQAGLIRVNFFFINSLVWTFNLQTRFLSLHGKYMNVRYRFRKKFTPNACTSRFQTLTALYRVGLISNYQFWNATSLPNAFKKIHFEGKIFCKNLDKIGKTIPNFISNKIYRTNITKVNNELQFAFFV